MDSRQRAHIAHSTPGRIRIVIPSKRHCANFFARLECHALSAEGVRHVRSRPAAASIVIHHEPGSNCLAVCAMILDLDLASRDRGANAPVTAMLVSLRVANHRIHQLTGGQFDLAWLLARALLFIVGKHPVARFVELVAEPLLRLLLTIEPEVKQPVEHRPLAIAA